MGVLPNGGSPPHGGNTQSPPSDARVAQWRREAVAELRGYRRSPTVPVPEGCAAAGPAWEGLPTVALHDEEHLHDQAQRQLQGSCRRWWWDAQGWFLAIAVGVCSSLTGILIEVGVNRLSSVRFGYCSSKPFAPLRQCPEGHWTDWGDGAAAFGASTGIGTAMAAGSALLVWLFAPAAAGSGIPEVKTILNGFVMADVVSLQTLCVKVPGLILSVASGMSLGKEGPMVHVAVCWAQLLSGLFLQFQNEGKRRELFAAAAAAGVSTAFGAPLGGVLFSLEEVSSHFPSRTLLRAFTAAAAAAVMLSVFKAADSKGLTLFSVEYKTACHPYEYVCFALLGIIGGLVGAAFNALNVRWSELRASPAFRKRVHGILEVTLIALVTLVTSWPLVLTQPLSADAIHAMFKDCAPAPGTSELRLHLALCTEGGQYAEANWELFAMLLGAAAVRFFQTVLTFGTVCPAGLFVPSLFTGACIGRCMGVALQAANANHRLFARDVEPGVYAMVGAAAVLGGVCRVTISLLAIMLELTGGMTYIVPFMLAVLVGKMVGDKLNEGIYDLYIVLRGYPFLQEELSVTFTERCCDVMETVLTTLDVQTRPTAASIRTLLQTYAFRGFPVVNGDHFIGYIKRQSLEELLDSANTNRVEDGFALEDVLPLTDCTVMRMVPDAPLTQVHKVFKQLGCKYVFLVGSKGNAMQDVLQGMLSKKNFLRFLKAGRVGHMAEHPSTVPPGLPRPVDLGAGSALGRLLWRRRGQGGRGGSRLASEAPFSGSLREWLGAERPDEDPEGSGESQPNTGPSSPELPVFRATVV